MNHFLRLFFFFILPYLITNAFYSVNEKKKSGAEHFEPTVSVSTKKIKVHIEISVADNENGTGLGLSLSYDIVRAQGGALKVESKEGESAEFIIRLMFE